MHTNKLLNSQKKGEMMKYRDPKPDILRIEELVKDVKSGDVGKTPAP